MPHKRERGQAVVLLVVGLSIFLIGALGIAIDGSHLFAQQQMAQSAADAAAQAGILSVFRGTNATATNPFATGSPPGSFVCSTTDGTTPCTYARLNGFGATNADSVAVSFPSSVSGVTNLASVPVPAISVAIQRTVNAWLIRFLGPSSSTVRASATAAIIKSPLANCITALDPAASGALSINGNPSVILIQCGVAVNSNSGSALAMTGTATLTADSIQVVGGVHNTGNTTIYPSPTTGASAVGDPLAAIPPPSFDPASSCNFSGLKYKNDDTATLSPGTYCGGLTVSGNAQVTLSPGTYIFRGGIDISASGNVRFGAGTYVLQGGGFKASGNAMLTGAGVTFYNTFDASDSYGPIDITGGFIANLSAPTSGPQQGMLFFQDRNAPAGNTEKFTGTSDQNVTGAFYFPNSTVSYRGNTANSPQDVAVIGDMVSLVGNANFTTDFTQPAAPHQIGVALIR
jgi:Flp pilus assembly protein TadG